MKRWKKVLIGLGGGIVALLVAAYVVYGGGQHEQPGAVHPNPLSSAQVAARLARQHSAQEPFAAQERRDKQILFGDLHVHTTFSTDAFLISLPLLGGEGAHPPADACDFARFCSDLDFYALTDHAEALTPRHWQESKESVRQCNAVAGDDDGPDLAAFIGWEWTQVAPTPQTHYGHKNVIFEGLADDELPSRPIAAGGFTSAAMQASGASLGLWLEYASIPPRDWSGRRRYIDFYTHLRELSAVPLCAKGVDSRELPVDCLEVAETPRELFDKLDQWGFDTVVIPHGTTWGFYTPPGSSWDKQVSAEQNDPDKQRLMEIYSGHGNAEEYRPWRAARTGPNGELQCPEPTKDYEPCCWRAGEIIRARCGASSPEDCERRVGEARTRYLALGAAGFRSIPGVTVEDWRDCGQCRDCFNPAYNYRPGGSVQYVLALGNFDDPERPQHARLGLLASSDNHTARPGTGYKEVERRKMTEVTGPVEERWHELVYGESAPPAPRALDLSREQIIPYLAVYAERQASFFMTGGLVALHSQGRSRGEIWRAIKRREVYGTSGDRILLWFDLINGPEGSAPMGSEIGLGQEPRFVVRAVGAFEQLPGCPEHVEQALAPERLQHLCAGECYHPSDRRRTITRIEVVRIRPQRSADEPIEPLIEDVWRRLDCPTDPAGCRVEFSDPDFVEGERNVLYYVRAIQEPTAAVNAGGVRCKDESCAELQPCYGGYRTRLDDDCLSDNEERAWSSPIWLQFDAKAAAARADQTTEDGGAP